MLRTTAIRHPFDALLGSRLLTVSCECENREVPTANSRSLLGMRMVETQRSCTQAALETDSHGVDSRVGPCRRSEAPPCPVRVQRDLVANDVDVCGLLCWPSGRVRSSASEDASPVERVVHRRKNLIDGNLTVMVSVACPTG